MRPVLVAAASVLLLSCGLSANSPGGDAGNTGTHAQAGASGSSALDGGVPNAGGSVSLGGTDVGGAGGGSASAGSTQGGDAAGAFGVLVEQSCGEAPRVAGSVVQPRVLVEEGGAVIPYDLINAQFGDYCWLGTDLEGNAYCQSSGGGSCVSPTFASVPLQRELVGDDDGLALITYTSADGARFTLGSFYDLERGVELYLSDPPEGVNEAQLSPQFVGPLSWYGSAPMDCPALHLPQPQPRDFVGIDGCSVREDTRFLSTETSTPGTPPIRQIFSTEPVDATVYWCYGTEGGPMLMSEMKRVLRSTEISVDAWSRGTRVRAGTGRYQFDAWQVGCHLLMGRSEAILRQVSVMYDTLRGDERCSFLDDGSGTGRCWPTDVAKVAYIDPECMQPVAVNEFPNEPVRHYARENSAVVTNPPLYEVGALISSGTPVYIHDSEPCISYQMGVGWDVYELGSVVSPEEFGLLRIDVQSP